MFLLFRWAVSTVMTRQNQIPTPDGSKMTFALIPLWDMCNHCNGLVSNHLVPFYTPTLRMGVFRFTLDAFVLYLYQIHLFLLVVKLCNIYRGYQMSVGLILNLLNQLNKSIICEPMTRLILFYSKSSINLVMNLHDFNILFITYTKKRTLNCKKEIILTDTPII